MKQLLSLFLFLLPCLALAQYPGNGNQKITLGEQTTADGLIWRGVAATDTVRKPLVDTMAYMVLDTTTNIMWHYKKATSNAWLRLNLLPSDTASMLTPYLLKLDTTNIKYVNTYGTQTVGGAKTFSAATSFSSTATATKFIPTGTSVSGNGIFLPAANTLGFSTNGYQAMTLDASQRLGIGINSPVGLLHLNSSGTTNLYIQSGTGNEAVIRYFSGTLENTTTRTNSSGDYYIETGINNPYERLRIRGNGEVNIGYGVTDNGAYLLQVKDSVYIGGNVSASAYTTRSDFNLKDDIFDLKYGLNDVLQLQPVEYTYKSNGSKQLGFIAQDIGTILPEVVSFEESMSVNYQAIIPILTKAIQEQNSLIKALEQRIINLENK